MTLLPHGFHSRRTTEPTRACATDHFAGSERRTGTLISGPRRGLDIGPSQLHAAHQSLTSPLTRSPEGLQEPMNRLTD